MKKEVSYVKIKFPRRKNGGRNMKGNQSEVLNSKNQKNIPSNDKDFWNDFD